MHILFANHLLWNLSLKFSLYKILITWTPVDVFVQLLLLVIQRGLIIYFPNLLHIFNFSNDTCAPKCLFLWDITLRGSNFLKLLLSCIQRCSRVVKVTTQRGIQFVSIAGHSTSSYIILQPCLLLGLVFKIIYSCFIVKEIRLIKLIYI